MIKLAKIVIFLFFYFNYSYSQNIHRIDIVEGLKRLEENSEEFKQINRNIVVEKLKYSVYSDSFLPKLILGLSVPSYKKSINSITQENGDNKFIEQSQATANLNLNLYQKISLTGGEITVKGSLNRLDNFSNKTAKYSSNWYSILLNQPLNGYNQFKWETKVNELKFNKNNLEILKIFEDKKRSFVDNYFEAYINNCKIKLTKRNIAITSEYLLGIESLYKQGRILESDVLMAKLSLNQLNFKLIRDKLNYRFNINGYL